MNNIIKTLQEIYNKVGSPKYVSGIYCVKNLEDVEIPEDVKEIIISDLFSDGTRRIELVFDPKIPPFPLKISGAELYRVEVALYPLQVRDFFNASRLEEKILVIGLNGLENVLNLDGSPDKKLTQFLR